MANELSLSIQINHAKIPFEPWRWPEAIRADQTGAGAFRQTVNIGTSPETISFGDVSPGLVLAINLDDTNFVDFGPDDSGTLHALGRLYPQSRWPAMIFVSPGATLSMQADTGACDVHLIAYEL